MKHRSIRGFLALSACAMLLAGCGPSLSYTVSPDLIKRLPKNSRRSVFQAETVVTIAVDRKSSVKRQIDNARREIDRTEERIRKVNKEAEGAGARDAEKIDKEIDMLDAKIDFLHEQIDHLEMSLKLAEKHSIAFGGSEEDFMEQAKSIQEDVDDMRKDVDKDAADLKRSEEEWLAVKKKYFSSIGESSKGWWTE